MIVEAVLNIKADRSSAWRCISNIGEAATILGGVEKIEALSSPAPGLTGFKWRETRLYFGKPASVEKWVTQAVVEEFYKTQAEMDGFVFITTLSITETGEGVLLKSTHETKPKGFMARVKAIPLVFFRGIMKKAILQDLEDYKSAIENKQC